MNVKAVVAVAIVCGSTMLGGCAALHSKGDPSAMAPGAESPGNRTADVTYMAAVDRQATNQGVQMVWVNPPDKARHD